MVQSNKDSVAITATALNAKAKQDQKRQPCNQMGQHQGIFIIIYNTCMHPAKNNDMHEQS